MKNIKYFMYKNTCAFERFLDAYGYRLKDVKGFSVYDKQQYRGNILKQYIIYLNDNEHIYFKVVYFKDFNECYQARFSFKCIELSGWYSSANVIKWKTKDIWGTGGKYVIEC